MKTAKEIAKEIFNDALNMKNGGAVPFSDDYEWMIKRYAREACKEQRGICAQEYAYDSPTNDSNNYEINGEGLKKVVMWEIENAPEPELK